MRFPQRYAFSKIFSVLHDLYKLYNHIHGRVKEFAHINGYEQHLLKMAFN